MPLKDHFHPPLSDRKSWESFHGGWAFLIAQRLNAGVLPRPFEAEQQMHIGPQIEIDAVVFEDEQAPAPFGVNGHDGGVATAVEVYAPPSPSLTGAVSFDEPDLIEIKIHRQDGGWKLVAAIELMSPANKDRASHRRAFAIKCASYLQKGVSVVVVDVVTARADNTYDNLLGLLKLPDAFEWYTPTGLSAVAYRTIKVKDQVRLDVWPFPLAVGEVLPTVPLWLAADLAVPLELELTYAAACTSLRIE